MGNLVHLLKKDFRKYFWEAAMESHVIITTLSVFINLFLHNLIFMDMTSLSCFITSHALFSDDASKSKIVFEVICSLACLRLNLLHSKLLGSL